MTADSTTATNVYAVARQFYDNAGFADYRQTFNPVTQVVQDTDASPQTNPTECAASPYRTCGSDQELQTEISKVIAAERQPHRRGPQVHQP